MFSWIKLLEDLAHFRFPEVFLLILGINTAEDDRPSLGDPEINDAQATTFAAGDDVSCGGMFEKLVLEGEEFIVGQQVGCLPG